MKRIIFYVTELHACGYIRGELIAREINQNFHDQAEMIIMDARSICESHIHLANTFVFERTYDMNCANFATWLRQNGKQIYYDIDDILTDIPPEFQKPYNFYSRPDVKQGLVANMKAAHMIVASTPYLARQLSHINDAMVIRNNLDSDSRFWKEAYAKRQQRIDDGTITIGYFASGSHIVDSPLIEQALVKIINTTKNVNFMYIGEPIFKKLFESVPTNRVKNIPWISPVDILPYTINQFDIGLCPLANIEYNKAKSDLKWMQYGLLDIPSIVSYVEPYKACADAGLAYVSSDDKWFESMMTLCNDAALRAKLGTSSRNAVRTHLHIREGAKQWIKLAK